jgi:hypothetical protein
MGDENKREILEKMLYSGEIKDEKTLHTRAEELGITIKITDNAEKIRKIGEVIVGEVKLRTPQTSRRKRLYGTTNAYQIIKLTGSNIESVEEGHSSIIVFGNNITKKSAKATLKKYWNSKSTLQETGELLKRIMEAIADITPSISPEYDISTVEPKINKKDAIKLLRNTSVQDVKELAQYRAELKDEMIKKAREIDIASRIMTDGVVGKVSKIEDEKLKVTLGEGVVALDTNWNLAAKKDDTILMTINNPQNVQEGDVVVIKDENLCISRTGSNLMCEIILCKDD